MRIISFLAVAACATFMFMQTAHALPVIGEAAPAFVTTDIAGNDVSLADLKGKTVVLEWTNHQCPFVRKHYTTNNMQQLQAYAKEQDVVWVSIISSGEGKQGYVTNEEAAEIIAEEESHATHVVRDPSGKIGRLYAAKTTPHMFVIDSDGMLAYMGAIDNMSTADPDDVSAATNYVRSAIDALQAGEVLESAVTTPYGCGVKYLKF